MKLETLTKHCKKIYRKKKHYHLGLKDGRRKDGKRMMIYEVGRLEIGAKYFHYINENRPYE